MNATNLIRLASARRDAHLEFAMQWLLAVSINEREPRHVRTNAVLVRVAVRDPSEQLDPKARRWLLKQRDSGDYIRASYARRLLEEVDNGNK